MNGLTDTTMQVLTQALDGLSSRQALISGNLSNIDTPGYQAQSIDFETALQQEVASMDDPTSPNNMLPSLSGPSANVAMKTTNPRQFSAVAALPGTTDGTGTTSAATSASNENLRNDGNTVDLETEMTNLTETQIKYSADSRLITSKFEQLYTVLGGH
jgi:flagellar basal-body rod protein FlgB